MTDSTQGQGHAATDLSPPVRLHVVVGYDATPPASRVTASRDARPGDTQLIMVGSSSHASHRVMGSVAVSLARHCPVPLVIVP
jgi:nucleotide-binding universal stress UspA family protein